MLFIRHNGMNNNKYIQLQLGIIISIPLVNCGLYGAEQRKHECPDFILFNSLGLLNEEHEKYSRIGGKWGISITY